MKKTILVIFASVLLLVSCAKNNAVSPQSEGVSTDKAKIQEVIKDLSQDEIPEERSNAQFGAVERVEIKIDGNPIRGDLNAPVTIIEFSDFQCPVCEQFHREVGKKIKEKYVDSGKVKLVYMDYPLYNIHDYALPAAKAGECAYKQGKFWQMHDYLFDNQYGWQKPDIKNILTNAAGELGINTESFSTCFDSDETLEKIGTDFYTGQSLEVRGTPTFFINGKIAIGYKTFDQLSELIEAELNNDL